MTRTTLLALASRVEAATGADESALMLEAVNAVHDIRSTLWQRAYMFVACGAYESAAMTLIAPDAQYIMGGNQSKSTRPWARLGTGFKGADVTAATPALALTAASLRAIAGSLTDD
jgi:hypothetical protein